MDSVQKSKRLYPAIELLRDPQGLAELILKRLRMGNNSNYKFQVKLLMINFLTRLVGNHELLLLPLYPYLQRYMGGHQRDVTAVLAYTVQACHSLVPPDEIYGILKTIAHNFITERCSGEQMAVGINAARAICARCPSVMNTEDESFIDTQYDNTSMISTNRVALDMEGFAQDLAGYAKHKDRSAAIAGRAWYVSNSCIVSCTSFNCRLNPCFSFRKSIADLFNLPRVNFVREIHPALLAGKDRGKSGSALARLGEKPLRYGEQRAAFGVEGADLLMEYEAKKAALATRCQMSEKEKNHDDDVESWETSNSEVLDGDEEISIQDVNEWEDVESGDEENEGSEVNDEDSNGWVSVDDKEDESEDDTAPELVNLDDFEEESIGSTPQIEPTIILSKLTDTERNALRQNISSTRIFSTADFEKMRKLVARAEREKRDPRAAARRKRMEAQGKTLEELSDNESSVESDDDAEAVKTAGVVRPDDIMAEAKRKRQSKAEKLEKIMAGREKFQHKSRAGGSTNEEKKRKKNFLMQKFSYEMRGRKNLKASAVLAKKKSKAKVQGTHEAKKRRRKL
jgi:protein SDA1